jgi:hypothetical protein
VVGRSAVVAQAWIAVFGTDKITVCIGIRILSAPLYLCSKIFIILDFGKENNRTGLEFYGRFKAYTTFAAVNDCAAKNIIRVGVCTLNQAINRKPFTGSFLFNISFHEKGSSILRALT